MSKAPNFTYFDRELSWLAFNARVLQEAQDPSVPLFERLKFLAIYSSNLDEFFRVRVASLRNLLSLKRRAIEKLDFDPAAVLEAVHATVHAQQEAFGATFRDHILPELRREGIVLLTEEDVTADQAAYLRDLFDSEVRPLLTPFVLTREEPAPFLENKSLYLVAELFLTGEGGGIIPPEPVYGIVNLPNALPRFVWVPGADETQQVIFLDDVIRLNLAALFPEYSVGQAHEVKLTRDAEMYLEDEFSGGLLERIRKGLSRRETGAPSRFLYDLHAPHPMIRHLQERFGLADEDLVPGARYHNFSDFAAFPRFGREDLTYPPLPPLPHPELEAADSLFTAIGEKDRLLSLPYQKFDYVVRLLREAAADPDVDEIWITLYRVANGSAVAEALMEAARRGKRVTAVVELKARFDEESNVLWAERMQDAGVIVDYGVDGLKVHAKLLLIVRREDERRRLYAYLSTGNFNENTARVYADHGLFTADPRLTHEARRVFAYLLDEEPDPSFEYLLVAPEGLRKALSQRLEREIEHAQAGRTGYVILKLNSLEDERIIRRLYEASENGVKLRAVVRGICRLIPGVEQQSANVLATSIVDRFLEHARLYFFHNDGAEDLYLASADWMRRNLNRRVEIAFPIYDPDVKQELLQLLSFQLADNQKARLIDETQSNAYLRDDEPPARAQLLTYEFYREKAAALPDQLPMSVRPAVPASPATQPEPPAVAPTIPAVAPPHPLGDGADDLTIGRYRPSSAGERP